MSLFGDNFRFFSGPGAGHLVREYIKNAFLLWFFTSLAISPADGMKNASCVPVMKKRTAQPLMQCLVFRVGPRLLAVGVEHIQELAGPESLNLRTEGFNDYNGQWIMLRGKQVPVYDLRILYADDPVDTALTTVIVVRTGMERDLAALVVDELGDLKALSVIRFEGQAELTDPDWDAQILFSGMSRVDHQPVMILDIGKLVQHGHAGRDGLHGHVDPLSASRRCS